MSSIVNVNNTVNTIIPTSSLFYPNELDNRLTAFPIGRPQLYKYYELAVKSFWTFREVDTSADGDHFRNKLNASERKLVKYILAFFAPGDGLVNVNIAERFKCEVEIREAEYFYNMQLAIEDIHANMYSLLLDTIVENTTERTRLIDSINTIPVVRKIAEWINNCVESTIPFAERLLRMVCIEGILFQSCFCVIYWLKSRSLMPGLAQSNELIARDERLHTEFALLLYILLRHEHQLTDDVIKTIFTAGVDLTKEFIADAMSDDMPEMNLTGMYLYIENICDNITSQISNVRIYGSKHTFTFMDLINHVNVTDFFIRRVSEYSKVSEPDDGTIATDF